MEKWILYALASMFFAGVTAVIAKLGLAGISAELGLAIRTLFVFALIVVFTAAVVPRSEVSALTSSNFFWLGLSALATALSWVFYYKAIKLGDVSTVALIDKGSVVVAMLLAVLVLKETLTVSKLVGGAMMVAGLFVIARDA